jgi:hypothetical protein
MSTFPSASSTNIPFCEAYPKFPWKLVMTLESVVFSKNETLASGDDVFRALSKTRTYYSHDLLFLREVYKYFSVLRA